ncbi:MAG TPA: TrkA family potassium uptake protein [Spirochaetia bacterium]|nr:TrkA family potassium uptake protein [Spirochaetia bacterium]
MKDQREAREAYVVIVGCGRLGAHLAEMVGGRGGSVVIIDKDPESFRSLPAEFSGFSVEGDASEIGVLRQAKAAQADLFIAVTGSDNLNLMAAQIAGRLLGAKRALARVDDPGRFAVFDGGDVEVISPTTIVGGVFLAL